MPSITLFGPSGAPFVLKVRGALALKALDYTLREPSGPEDFRRWSPQTGLLPVIDVDGVRVHDSAAILDHLDLHFPEPPLLSSDPKVASSQRRLEAWAEATFIFYWMAYLRELVDPGRAPVGRERRRRRGGQSPGRGEGGLAAEFRQRLDDLVNFLGGRPFFYAERISRADLAVYSFLARLPDATAPEIRTELDSRPALTAYLARVEAATPGLAQVVPPRGTPVGAAARP
jgi:glutathione S-transferase